MIVNISIWLRFLQFASAKVRDLSPYNTSQDLSTLMLKYSCICNSLATGELSLPCYAHASWLTLLNACEELWLVVFERMSCAYPVCYSLCTFTNSGTTVQLDKVPFRRG